MAHRGALPGRADRFRSDLGLYGEIEDPFLRDFTQASREAGAPVGDVVLMGAK